MKILLNSLYGALLNPYCRFFDKRVGQSVTLTGRCITQHMASKINEIITGEYNHVGDAIAYGDSVDGSSIIQTQEGPITVEDLFEQARVKWSKGDRLYAADDNFKVLTYNPETEEQYFSDTAYIYKHEVEKEMFEITDDFGNTVIVTEDHSVMVWRDGEFIEVKPVDLKESDKLISNKNNLSAKLVKALGKKKQSVFDISVNKETPYFFANNILVHNTDSSYFSLDTALKNKEELQEIFKDFDFTKENVIELYDTIADEVNNTFTGFLVQKFNVNPNFAVIKAGREIVASKALFIKKKRYAALVYDKEGSRKDKGDKAGEIKAMGLDLKRSDTPKYVQMFLENLLEEVLTGVPEEQVINTVKRFKKEFREKPAWEKGTPKKVNSLTDYTNRYQSMMDPEEIMELEKMKLRAKDDKAIKRIQKDIDKLKKVAIPGHVMASINYNRLKKLYNDNYSMPIQDGQKIIVCKLKENPLKVRSVAYPIDESNLPDWFKKLPFDEDLMEETIVDKKVHNLLYILGWDLERARNTTTFDDLFSL